VNTYTMEMNYMNTLAKCKQTLDLGYKVHHIGKALQPNDNVRND